MSSSAHSHDIRYFELMASNIVVRCLDGFCDGRGLVFERGRDPGKGRWKNAGKVAREDWRLSRSICTSEASEAYVACNSLSSARHVRRNYRMKSNNLRSTLTANSRTMLKSLFRPICA